MTSVKITSSWSQIGLVLLSAGAMLAAIIFYLRIIGLRSFSKMSSFDFAVTVAMGSLLASVTLSGSSLADGLVGAGALLLVSLQSRTGGSASGRAQSSTIKRCCSWPDRRCSRKTCAGLGSPPDDVRAKLRQANIHRYGQVPYVVLETTGDVTVVQGDGPLEQDILADVTDAELLFDN